MAQIIGAKDVPLPPDFLSKIAADPSLSANEVHLLQSMVTQESKNAYDREAANYGPGFHDAVNALQLPNGDPNRITTSADILKRYGPDGLSSEGVSKINSMLGMNFKSADDAAVNRTMAGLYNYAKSKLSFEQDTGPIKIRDPDGEKIFNSEFIPKFNQSFDQWVKDGKNPWDFLTRKNIDDMTEGMRPKAQMEQDRLRAYGEAGPQEATGQNTAPVGIDNKVWQAQIASPPMSPNGGGLISSQAWDQVLRRLVSRPNDIELRNAIHQRFPDVDIDGLLHKITGSNATRVPNALESPTNIQAPEPHVVTTSEQKKSSTSVDEEADKAAIEKVKNLGKRFGRYYGDNNE
jgi:hypothetical protein